MKNSDTNCVFKIESLLIGYGGKIFNPLLPSITASANERELIAIIGQNGTGKSTLLKTIAGLLKPLGGTIYVEDKNIEQFKLNELAHVIGYVSTEQIRVENMKVIELVGMGRYPYTSWTGNMTAEDHEKISVAVEQTGLINIARRFINELSDGERQRAMIGRVVAQDTHLILLDEPTAFLDINHKYEIIHLLRKLADENNKSILFSTHDIQAAMNECDRIWMLSQETFCDGAPEDLVLRGDIEKLFSNPHVFFDKKNARVSFRKDFIGEVYISGKGDGKLLTEKAVQRVGFRSTSNNSVIKIEVEKDESGYYWTCRNYDKLPEKFRTIYETIRWLKTNYRSNRIG
ncbi:MAG: ABC transporter ATP-binding protein [Bacteroidales bacterium]|nr:ABC transporter ATP-binding protein [Bacteroidales bacterium]